ncbi:MAG: ATPase, T2SS/T4P/T4SS family, partial [Pyrinomonadaceae bacterium]
MAESLPNLLGVMSQQSALELRLEPGVPVMLVTASGNHNISSAPMTTGEIGAMVLPLIDENVRKTLSTSPEAQFTYTSPGIGEFNVLARKSPKGLIISFTPGGQDSAPASAPVPSNGRGNGGSIAGAPVSPNYVPELVPVPMIQNPSGSLNQGQPVSRVVVPPRSMNLDTRKMDVLLRAMADGGGSDLHLSVSMPPLMRKDGQIVELGPGVTALTADTMRPLLLSIIPQSNREEFERRHDTDFAYEIAGLARFRCNIFMDRKGMGGVFRVIPSSILTAEKLGLSPAILNLCKLNKGLVVVTGPTGSGKSTTLCAMVDYINNTRADHLITIEDPIEFVHENKKCLVNQREVHNHTESFKDALRAALREDPDIVLVGEMRDLETI